MNLDQYLSSDGAPTVSELRKRMLALGYQVKSDAQIRQWRHAYNGRRPDAANCVGLEKASGGLIQLQDLRPDDWHLIWPALADHGPSRDAGACVEG